MLNMHPTINSVKISAFLNLVKPEMKWLKRWIRGADGRYFTATRPSVFSHQRKAPPLKRRATATLRDQCKCCSPGLQTRGFSRTFEKPSSESTWDRFGLCNSF